MWIFMAGILTFNILARIGRVRGAGGNRLVLPRHRLSFEDSYMTRKSLRFWLVPLLLGPACALALEIGEIQVSSALNQLFDARIPLLALTPEESEKVSVSLASKAMFKEFGLERTSALTNLVFSIEYNAEGLVYVRAVSTQPIREPSLGLLLEFNWPRGKTFREFTVFLDPVQRLAKRPSDRTKTVLTAPEPVPAAPVAAPPVAATAPPTPPVAAPPVAATAPPTPPVAAPIVAPPSSEQTESSAESLPVAVSPPPVKTYKPGDNYGPITPGEGLWGIALKVRPDPSISREHMMQALLKANPQAFSKAGVDGLKIGAVLRIPTLREIVDLTGSLAARQLAEAESPSSPAPTIADQTPSDAAPAPPAAESARVVTGELETFPLAPQAIPEPTVVVAPSSSAPEAVEPKPESKSEPKPAVAEPAVAAAEPEAPKPEISKPVEPEAPKPEIVAAEPETPKPVVAAAEPEAPKPEISKPVEPEAPKPEIVAAEPEAPKPVVAAAEPEVPKPEIVATEPETPKPEIVA
ncbi:MAG TPA: FimV/HubP family polar landmark protein, partial [Candidatus Competibacteraceae bacterium]|nr:FimV/HubP family polar landmark protein [Candidatus Competibacteraceae bacterium]